MSWINFEQLASCQMEVQKPEEETVYEAVCGYPPCAKTFAKRIFPSQRRIKHYCSPECHGKDRSIRVDVKCAVCGTVKTMTQSDAKKARTCYAPECIRALRSKRSAETAARRRAQLHGEPA